MSFFEYRAKTKKGEEVKGTIEAVSKETVAAMLAEQKLIILDIRQHSSLGFSQRLSGIFQRVGIKDLMVFFRQLAVMIDASMPFVKALRISLKQTTNKRLKVVINSLADEVEGGAKLSDAMANFPNVFSNFYINVIKSGETAGRLGEVLNYLADQEEKDYDMRSKVRGAMMYPAFILGGLVIIGFVISVFVIPPMTSMLKESGVPLTFLTRILIGSTEFISHFWWLIMLLAIMVFAGLVFYVRTPRGRIIFDLFQLKIPIFGKIFQHIYIVRFCRSFNVLIRGGVPIARALETVRDVVVNSVYRELLDNTIKEVDEGNSIADSLSQSKYMPSLIPQMISVGEETGKLEEILARLTAFYTREIDNKVATLSTLIEPVVMILLGVAVGLFVTAVIMPIWQMSSTVQ